MMQQDRGRRGHNDHQEMKRNNQQQDQTSRALTTVEIQQQQPPQKCPRCDSLNTKFCYYNNYSLSQPRYLCKTCRRYWTQGGTLRNVPVGGGCRKRERTKISSSSSGENSRSTHTSQVLPHQATHQPLSMTMISSNPMINVSSAFKTKESSVLATSSTIRSIGSYYPDARSLSSLASIQSMNQPQPFNQLALDQTLNIDGDSSNLCLVNGYGYGYRYDHQERLIQSSRVDACDSSQHNWHHQGFINNNDPTFSEAAMWSFNNNNNSHTSSAAKINTNNTIGDSLNPNQWLDLSGYGAPP